MSEVPKSYSHDSARLEKFLEPWGAGVEQPEATSEFGATAPIASKPEDVPSSSDEDEVSTGGYNSPVEGEKATTASMSRSAASDYIEANPRVGAIYEHLRVAKAAEVSAQSKMRSEDNKALEKAGGDKSGPQHWSDRIPVWRSIKAIQRQVTALEAKLGPLETKLGALETKLTVLSRCLGFEHAQDPAFDQWYQSLQDLHRGSSEELALLQSSYLPYFETRAPVLQPAGPILDLGCGRGEWLSLMAGHGWQVRGIDSSELAVKAARDQGIEVLKDDVLIALESQPANSLAAVTAFQVIEHLPFECVVALVQAAFRALLPGGILLFETPNPENLQVATYSFWMDPTHKKPIPPPLLMDLSFYAGFRDGLVLRQNPWPNWHGEEAEPSLEGQMNQRLYGPQDYALIAYKPVTSS